MSNKVALRYAVIQFMPYLETGEFANVGIVAMCPKTGYFDYKITPKYGRLTKFFPNLQGSLYKAAISFFEKELLHIRNMFAHSRVDPEMARTIFDNLTRDREAIVRTTNISVRMATNETEALNQLFDYYVAHSFAKDNSENILTERVTAMVKSLKLVRPFTPEKIGNDEFHATFPLVQKTEDAQPSKIIKPIYLGQEDPSKIYEKSDSWLIRINRLRSFELLNKNTRILFAFEPPFEATKAQSKALNMVLKDIKKHKIDVVDHLDKNRINEFAAQ